MAGRWRRFCRDGWLEDLVTWIEDPSELFSFPRRDPQRPRRRVFIDRNGNVVPDPATAAPHDEA